MSTTRIMQNEAYVLLIQEPWTFHAQLSRKLAHTPCTAVPGGSV